MVTQKQALALAVSALEMEMQRECSRNGWRSSEYRDMHQAVQVLRSMTAIGREERKLHAKRLLEQSNLSFREIARQTGLHYRTVSRMCQHMGRN